MKKLLAILILLVIAGFFLFKALKNIEENLEGKKDKKAF